MVVRYLDSCCQLDLCGFKSELPDFFWWKVVPNYSKIDETIYRADLMIKGNVVLVLN
jgi:hypothetical protein